MTYIWPRALFLLVLVPILVVAYLFLLRKRKRSAVRYAGLSLVREAMNTGVSWRRYVPPILFLLSFSLLLFSVARPAAIVVLPSQRGTVILAMDISGSMRATDIEPSRIAAAQAAARTFVSDQPPNVRIGVVAFAGTASLVQPPTMHRDDILAAIDRFHLQRGTAIGSAILASLAAVFEGTEIDLGLDEPRSGAPLGQLRPPATRAFEPVEPGSYRSAVIVLLTDGQTTTGPNPIEMADLAADLGVRIFTVGLGTTAGEILGFGGRSMRVQLDESSLRLIADRTHGRYFHAGTEGDLHQIYRSLGSQFSLETEQTDLTAVFAAVAAAFALISAILSVLWFHRVV
jgi:Ca-activated chloride channel homolog